MPRQYLDCREFPSDTKCTVAIAADSESELLEVAVQHAVAVHGHTDTPEFRKQLASIIKKGTPPLEAPAQQAATSS
jgi:predicted small metal-binding protein